MIRVPSLLGLQRILSRITGSGFITFSGAATADRIHTLQDAAGTIPLIEIQPCASFQNKLINPRFDIWQRGTSFAAIASGAYHADRWATSYDGSGAATISQQTHTIGAIATEPEYFLRYNVTTAGAGGTFRTLYQMIENVRTLAGKRVIVSCWMKADAARSVTPQFGQIFGSGGSPSSAVYTTGSAFSVTTSWQQFTQVLDIPSISGKTIGTNRDSALQFVLSIPLNVLCTIDISDVEVKEVAPSAQVNTPMEIRPLQVELALCQRYYHKTFNFDVAPAQNAGTTGAIHWRCVSAGANFTDYAIRWPVPMRATPSIVTYNPSAANAQARDTSGAVDCSGTAIAAGTSGGDLYTLTNAATAVNNLVVVHYTASAEL
jgi:hypothetical protein